MIYKYKEYWIKMKMVRQLWPQVKMKFLLSFNMEIVFPDGEANESVFG